MKVFLTKGSENYAKWLSKDIKVVVGIQEADLVIFTGGEDVSPIIYGETQSHKYTQSDIHRDNVEQVFFRMAKDLGKPILGICRGLK